VNQQLQAMVTLSSPREVTQNLLNRTLVWLQILKVLEKRRISCFCWEYLICSKRQTKS